MPSNEAFVRIRHVSFSREDRVIFDHVDLDIPRGKITGIMGPSGCGKTTLLRLIGGQLKPDAGEVWVDGKNIPTLNRRDLFEIRSRMGMLFQSGALFTDLSVYENVAFPLRVHTTLSEEKIREIVLLKLLSVGLRGADQLMPAQLSGGMARRAALARATALNPELVMYDEPFAGQDPIAMGVLVELIRSLNNELGHTSIVVSHDVKETASIADYLYVIAEGRVIGQGTPEEILHSESPMLKQFIHGLPEGPLSFNYSAKTGEAK